MSKEEKCCEEPCMQVRLVRDTALARLSAVTYLASQLREKLESGQLVEVVRCKDCIISYRHDDDDIICGMTGVNVGPDDFCSRGTRKDGE